jgi:UDP-N-acetyl-2-amino-2-deoxyglucuronate dehydrogenase
MEKVKTAVVGLGKVADTHATALLELEESDFRAVCSRSIEKAKKFAKKYNVLPFQNIAEMITQAGIQAVLICTPHPFHALPTIEAAQAGAHVMVEKPLASSLQDCDKMIDSCNTANVKLAMISQRRMYPAVRRVKEAIEQNKIGKPVLGTVSMLGWRDKAYYESDPWRGTWEGEGGGVLVNQAPHQIDLIQWLMGSDIEELYGNWINLNHPYLKVEDTAVAILKFKNGAVGNILVSNSQNPALYGKVHIHGYNGASVGVQTESGAMFIAGMTTITDPPLNDLWTIPGEENLLEKWKEEDSQFFETIDATQYFHKLQIQDFLQAILENRDPQITGLEARKTVEIFTAIYRSERDKKPVKFPLVPEYNRTDYDGRLGIEL